jgi:ligand-binding sensor domain-containing protein/signal transduction histidine kinase
MKFSAEHRRATRLLVTLAAILVHSENVHQLRAAPLKTEPPVPTQTLIRTLPSGIAFSQTRVSDIMQDSKGFLWIGTQYGLNRYDGFRVRQFLHDSADANSVGCSYIQALFKDRSGHLWVSCEQSLDRYEPETERFTHFRFQADDGSPDMINALVEDQDGSFWLATHHGVLRFNPKTRREARISLAGANDPALENQDVIWIEEDRAHHLWAMTQHSLVRLDRTSGKVEQRVPIPYTPAVGSFHEDRWGNFWVLAAYRLYSCDRETHRLTEISSFPGLKMKPYGALKLGALHTMLEDVDGDMWFGTENEGIIHISHAGRAPERFFHQIGTMNALPSSRVTALFQDRSGDIWVGFHDTAPIVIQRGRTSSRVIAFRPWVAGGLKSSLATSLFELEPGRLLLATSSAIQLLEEQTGKYSEPFPFLDLKDVFDVYRDQRTRLWFATDKGIYRFDQHTKHVDQLLPGSDVYRFLKDRAGRLWIMLTDDLLLYSPATDSFTSYAKPEPGESYYTIADSPDGTLWLGGSRGVKQVDVGTRHVRAFPYLAGSDKGPSDPRINALRFDTQARLWVGTQSGLNLYDPQEQRFHRFAKPANLGGQIVSAILEDQRQNLWLSSNQGLIKFDPATHVFTEYSGALGVDPVDLSGWGACFKTDSGRLLFGGFGGIVIFTPEEIERPSVTPEVFLTDLRVNNREARIGPKEILSRSIAFTHELDLTHSQNDLAIEFTTFDFRNVEADHFRYRLEGQSDEWFPVPAGQHALTFTHLDPKRYTLQLQAASFDGLWREPGVKLVIKIAKPWWSTWWMYGVYLLCFCLVAWMAYYFRIRQLAAIFHARTEGRVRERTALARHLHDTLIQDFQGVLLRFESTASQMPEGDIRRGELTSAITRAEMSLVEGRDALEAMHAFPKQMTDLAGAFEDAARELNFLSAAKVEVRADLRTPHDCGYDVNEIFQIGKEALQNALQHARAQLIQIRLTSGRESFELVVTDDGIGIPSMSVSGDSFPGHWGIRDMRERAQRLGGTVGYSLRPEGGSELRFGLPNPQLELQVFRRWRTYLKRILGGQRH